MPSFESVLEGIEGHAVYKKKQIKGGRFLYSYRDARKAAIEEADYPTKAENKKTFEPEKYSKKSSLFGVIVFEELEALGLSEPVPKPEPKKRRRKKKEPEVSKAKRPRGCPRKDANPSVGLL